MRIPPVKVVFTESDRAEICRQIDEVLTSGVLAQDRYVAEFEARFAGYVGARHAIAVHSGSNAIEIPMRALGVEGKEVLVPVNTFAATAAGVILAGGRVRFVDADPATFAITLEEVERRRTSETVGVVVVHIGGIITPQIEAIRDWCHENGLWLFEDAAHAQGSAWKGVKAGRFGIAGSYSFFATKVMTTAEGGMIVTDDDALAEQCRLYRNHGKPQPWVSYHVLLAANSRMSELNAILGLSQLRRLDEFIAARRRVAEVYTRLLSDTPGLQLVLPRGPTSWYKYIVLLPPGLPRDLVKAEMKARGISLAGEVYELPLHQQPIFSEQVDGRFPHAEDICARHICLPIYVGMSDDEAAYVAEQLKACIAVPVVAGAA
jgi:dTDP-4-amino-4,6-dideoxygalactose transaminase